MVIDEQPYFRAGVRSALSHSGYHEISESAPDSKLMDKIEDLAPEVVLLGADLAQHKSLELAGQIARTYPSTKVVMLSLNRNDEELFNVIRSSVVACLTRDAAPGQLVDVIERSLKGEYPINDEVMQHPVLAKQVLRQFEDMTRLGGNLMVALTKREIQILEHVANGNTNKQIAFMLGINEQTIKNHVSAILRKLNANDRAHAVVLAIKNGLISLS